MRACGLKRAAAAVIAALSLVGAGCGGAGDDSGGGGNPPPATPTAALRIEPNYVDVSPGDTFAVDVVVNGSAAFVAWDLGVQIDAVDAAVQPATGVFVPVSVAHHPDFDDDGALFGQSDWDLASGRLSGIVDLRHGGAGVSGDVRVATIWLSAATEGYATLTVVGDVVDQNGALFEITSSQVTFATSLAP